MNYCTMFRSFRNVSKLLHFFLIPIINLNFVTLVFEIKVHNLKKRVMLGT